MFKKLLGINNIEDQQKLLSNDLATFKKAIISTNDARASFVFELKKDLQDLRNKYITTPKEMLNSEAFLSRLLKIEAISQSLTEKVKRIKDDNEKIIRNVFKGIDNRLKILEEVQKKIDSSKKITTTKKVNPKIK